MKRFVVSFLFLISVGCSAQRIEFTGKYFWAMTVPNTTETSTWYETVFDMKLLKEIRVTEGNIHIRIIGNESLTIEIGSFPGSKTLADCSLTQDDSHKLQGIFKTGFYVKDIQAARKYFTDKGVTIRHDIYEDAETRTKGFIFVDSNNQMVQVLQAL